MTTRKSTRLQNLPTHESSEQTSVANAPRKKSKPNAPSAAPKTSTQGAGKGKAKGAKLTTSKGKQAQIQAPSVSAQDQLSSLPPEILKLTLDNVTDLSTISSLGRTCRNLYSHMMPRLYNRVAVAAAYHAHIPKLIRTLEPHLTIAQKKQLKKEGKYKGQQERYPSGLSEKARPICATYVSQMIVGMADPGRKHKYIVDRYVEEAFKNMDNLQIVETQVYTKSIGESIASMKNLKALRLFTPSALADGDIQVLDTVKDLKHLYLQDNGSTELSNTTQCLLRNSMSTLQSLVLETGTFCNNPFKKDLAIDNTETHLFSALEFLSFSGMTIDSDVIKSFRLVDFMQLRELTLNRSNDNECLLFPYLASLATSSQETATGITLRSLNVNMGDSYHWQGSPEKDKAIFEAKCHFISSFNTLISLKLPDYTFKEEIPVNPRLTNLMIQAILKHKNLKVLRIGYMGISSGSTIPYLSAANVEAIIGGLPKLEEFEFAPDEGQMTQIGKCLAKGTNLTTIKCFPYASWSTYPPPERPGFVVLSGIMKGFLASDQEGSETGGSGGEFIWEKHCKLQMIEVSSQAYALASEFGKLEKGAPKPEKMSLGEEGGRSVWFRSVTRSWKGRINQGFDIDHPWATKVGKLLG